MPVYDFYHVAKCLLHRLSLQGSIQFMRFFYAAWGRGEGESLSIHLVSIQCAGGLTGAGRRGPLLYVSRQPTLSSILCPEQQLCTVSEAGQHLERSGLSISLGVCLLVSERWSHRCRQTPGLTLAVFSRHARTTWVFSPLWSPQCALKFWVSPLFPH